MPAIGADPPHVQDLDVAGQKRRLRVPNSVGRQLSHCANRRAIDPPQGNLGVDGDARMEPLAVELLAGDGRETLHQLRQPVGGHGEARRLGMPSVALEQIITPAQRVDDAELGDAATARPSFVGPPLVDHRRPVILFPQKSGDQPDDARREVRIAKDQDRRQVAIPGQRLPGLGHGRPRELLALGVLGIEPLGQSAGFLMGGSSQQLEARVGAVDTPWSVDARTQPVADGLAVDLARFEIGHLQQRLKSRPFGAIQALQSLGDQVPVLTSHG